MTRFPTYPPDILSRADALLSEKYPDGIVDPRFVEIACEAMIQERERAAQKADGIGAAYGEDETGWFECSETIAKAIRGTK